MIFHKTKNALKHRCHYYNQIHVHALTKKQLESGNFPITLHKPSHFTIQVSLQSDMWQEGLPYLWNYNFK